MTELIKEIKKRGPDCKLNLEISQDLLRRISQPTEENLLIVQFLIVNIIEIVGMSGFFEIMAHWFSCIEKEYGGLHDKN